MSAISDKTMKRLTWIDDKWADFLHAIERPALLAIYGYAALLGVFAVLKLGFFILNAEMPSVMNVTAAIILGGPVFIIGVLAILLVALLIASTPLIVAGRVVWLVKNAKSLKKHSAEGGIAWATTSTIMFTIAGALCGIYGLTHNAVGMEGTLAFTGIGMAVGIGIGAWGMFGTAVAHRTGWVYSSL